MRRKLFVRPIIALALVWIVFFPLIPAAVTQSSNSSLSLRDQIIAKQSLLDKSKAVALAAGSNRFQALARGLGFSFNSIFNTWSYSTASDGSVLLNWIDVNVVYSLRNVNGSTTNLVVSEDPGLTRVLNVSLDSNLPQIAHLPGIPTNSVSNSPAQSPTLSQPTAQLFAQQAYLPNSGTSQLSQTALSCATNGSLCANQPALSNTPVTTSPMSPTTPDFSISATVTQMSFTAGGSSSSVITLGSINSNEFHCRRIE